MCIVLFSHFQIPAEAAQEFPASHQEDEEESQGDQHREARVRRDIPHLPTLPQQPSPGLCHQEHPRNGGARPCPA